MKTIIRYLGLFCLALILLVACDNTTEQALICKITSPNNRKIYSPGDTIFIQYSVSDELNKITEIILEIDDQVVLASENISDNYNWDTKDVESGSHTITVTARNHSDLTSLDGIIIIIEPDYSQFDNGYFTDSRDLQIYKWVKIGGQIWMTENLNFLTGLSFVYNNNSSNAKIYGRLYTWEQACVECPKGWHLPSDMEWIELEVFLGMDLDSALAGGNRFSEVACKLKSADTIYWNSPNFCATNESGFSALPGGYHLLGYETSKYYALGNSAFFWTSTSGGEIVDPNTGELILPFSIQRVLGYSSNNILRTSALAVKAFSVRCIKNP